MPETASQNDIYQVRVQGRIEGQETNNVLHFRCASGAGDDDVLTHLILVLAQCFIDHLLPVLSQDFTLERIYWKRVSPTLGPEFISVPEGFAAGGTVVNAFPSFVSAVVSIRTATGGRSHRGRFYLPGLPENAATGSAIDPGGAFWAGLLAFAACLVTNFIPGDPVGAHSWALGVYSRKLGGATFPFTLAGFTGGVEFLPNSQLGTTRSRKVGRGS